MAEVLCSPSPSSSSSPSSLSCVPSEEAAADVASSEESERRKRQLSLLALLVTLFRRSFWKAETEERDGGAGMEIGWPTEVRHVAHVTFDRFNGFLGLPVEFEPEVPTRAPSASATVFGVSTESMQLTNDSRGNSVPTILLLLQRRLYTQGGLEAEGIFRINAENGQEEHVRDQLNRGQLPDGIDVHCLAGLIKAWFRELPTGVLDSLSPEQVTQSQSEEDYSSLVRLLPSTEAALLNWAINLMADVVQHQHLNKMNAHNIAMVFAPNMTQMADPLTALMYAVQVMNFLKTLVEKALRERENSVVEASHISDLDYSDENGHRSPSPPLVKHTSRENSETETSFISEKNISESTSVSNEIDAQSDSSFGDCETVTFVTPTINGEDGRERCVHEITGQTSVFSLVRGQTNKSKELSNLSRINSITERIEAWR